METDSRAEGPCFYEAQNPRPPVSIPPAPDGNQVLLAPFGFEAAKCGPGGIPVYGLICKLQAFPEFLLVPTCHIFDGVTYLIHNVQLNGAIFCFSG